MRDMGNRRQFWTEGEEDDVSRKLPAISDASDSIGVDLVFQLDHPPKS